MKLRPKQIQLVFLLKLIVLEGHFFWDEMLCSLVVRTFQNFWYLSTKICDVTSQWTLKLMPWDAAIYLVTLFFFWTCRRRKRKVSVKKDAHLIGVSTYRPISWMKHKRRWSWRRLSYWMIVLLVARVSSCDQCTATAQIWTQRLSSQAQRLAVQYLYYLSRHRSAGKIIIFSEFKYRMPIKYLYILLFCKSQTVIWSRHVKFSFKLFVFGFKVAGQLYILVHLMLIILCKNKDIKSAVILVN